MRRFTLWVFALWAVLAVVCGGVIAASRARGGPSELQARGFDWCERFPCYLGIEVEVTPLSEAETVVLQQAALLRGQDFRSGPSGSSVIASLKACGDFTTVCLLDYFDNGDSPISVGMLIQHYGIPDAVSPNDYNDLEFHFPGLFAFIRVDSWENLDVHTPVRRLTLFPHGFPDIPEPCQQEAVSDLGMMVCWHGFASVRRYLVSP